MPFIVWLFKKSRCRISSSKGNYIVDFYCSESGIAIEPDDSQYYEEDVEKYDEKRTEYLKQYGLKVIRIPDNEISRNFDSVCEYLDNYINSIP